MNYDDAVGRIVLTRFTRLFGLPKNISKDDFGGFCAEYRRALLNVSHELLTAAVDRLIDEQLIKTWPLPGVVLANVKHIANERRDAKAREVFSKPPAEPYRKPTDEERARVQILVDETLAILRAAGQVKGKRSNVDWERASRPAWEDRYGG